MSLYTESAESFPDVKVRLAFEILSNIVPKLLNDGVYIGSRVSLAYTWSRFLCRIKECPDTPRDIREWNLSHIRIVADELIDYAMDIVGKYVKPKP